MRIFRHYNDLPADMRGAAVAVGNFDGVHLGHRAVIGEAGLIAKASSMPWAVLTFEPHPRSVFTPDIGPFRLTPFRIKVRHIEEMGVDCMVVLHFDRQFSQRTAEDFVAGVVVGGLAARHVVSGYDFVFGQGREGDCEMLLRMGQEQGFDFTCVSPGSDQDGVVYSSTRVRERLAQADPSGAAGMLGRDFEIEGRIERGEMRGRSIGFPTANIHLGEYLRPAGGVYAVRAGIDLGVETAWRDGVANLGHRPTFGGADLVLEVHIFDFDDDIYGQHLRVALIEHLRDEKKFDRLDDLKAQIADDREQARLVLAEAGK